MLVNFLVLLVWLPSLLGWGASLQTILGRDSDRLPADAKTVNFGVTVIAGFVPMALLSACLHFFIAIGPGVSVALLGTGYFLSFRERRHLFPTCTYSRIIGLFIVMALVSLFASKPLTHFDTGLYHIQALKWTTTHPLIRGLANLHERLAFTSLWTPVSAVLDYPRFGPSDPFSVTSLLLVGFGWATQSAILDFNESRRDIANIFLAGCGCFWMWMVVADNSFVILPSLSSDAPVYVLTLLSTYLLLRFCARGFHVDLFQALALSALALTTKVSAAPLLLFLVCFVFINRLSGEKRTLPSVSVYIIVGIIVSLLVGLWVARSVCLSGYLVFPLTFTALPFLPWHLPVPMAEQLIVTLKAWARWPGVPPQIVLSSSFWLRPWFLRLFEDDMIYTIFAYALTGLGLAYVGRKRIREPLGHSAAAGVMLVLGSTYWFLTAPDPRYGYGYLFAAACLLLATGLASFEQEKAGLMTALLALTTLAPLITATDFSHFHWQAPCPVQRGQSLLVRTTQGFPIFVTVGDQCILDGPLPSTPYFRPTLMAKINAQGRLVEFDLRKPVKVPYYGPVAFAPPHTGSGLGAVTRGR